MDPIRPLAALAIFACCGNVLGAESIHDRFMSMDTNHDGRVDAQEHAAAASAMFKQLDLNLDGAISVDEMQATRKAMDQPADEAQVRQAIAAMDRNGDGRVDAQEHLAMATALFKRTDANQDGYVTEAEMKQAAGPGAN